MSNDDQIISDLSDDAVVSPIIDDPDLLDDPLLADDTDSDLGDADEDDDGIPLEDIEEI